MRCAVLLASLGLAGCFYVDPINQRPSLDIRPGSSDPVFRGDEVSYTAVAVDPDDHDVDVTWRVYACTDATRFADCDDAPMVSDVTATLTFTVPMTRLDPDGDGPLEPLPLESLRIVLDGIDDHGAAAKPNDQLIVPVLDHAPDLELRATSTYAQPGPQYVVGMPIDVFAKYGDGDDALDALIVDWKVYAPMQVPIDLVDRSVPQDDPTKRQIGKILTPQIEGEWTVEVTVTDPGGSFDQKTIPFNVVPDRAPCLAQVAPIVPPAGVVLPVTEPTLFQVPLVSDDLDSYPKTPGGALFGEATFVWSILAPGNPRTVIGGATGSSTVFDPATFAPGTIVELRVEIQDRKLTPVNCADGEATCSTGGNSCIQRQTWRVEAR